MSALAIALIGLPEASVILFTVLTDTPIPSKYA